MKDDVKPQIKEWFERHGIMPSSDMVLAWEDANSWRPESRPAEDGLAREAEANYRGMEYPLEQLPAIWRTLADELRGNAKESKADDPDLARCFESGAISIIACAEQLQWSLAHRSPPLEPWQLIETAPKDGMHILAAIFRAGAIGFGICGGKHQDMMTVVHWWGDPTVNGFYPSISEDEPQQAFPATHWMPLPAPPLLKSARGDEDVRCPKCQAIEMLTPPGKRGETALRTALRAVTDSDFKARVLTLANTLRNMCGGYQ